MRICRLFVLSAFLIGVSLSANAQYTSKSSSGFTSKTSAAAPKPQPQQAKTYAAPASAGTAKTNSYTNSASASAAGRTSYTNSNTATTNSAVNARPAAAMQVRPTAPAAGAFRPKAPITTSSADNTEDSGDELPSFDVIEDNGTPRTPEQQKQLIQMPEKPDGEILIYFTDFIVDDSSGDPVMCSWNIVVQNNTNLSVQALRFTYKLMETEAQIALKNIAPGSSKQKPQGAFTKSCYTMKQKKLKTIEIKKCKIGDIINQACMEFIKFK